MGQKEGVRFEGLRERIWGAPNLVLRTVLRSQERQGVRFKEKGLCYYGLAVRLLVKRLRI